MPLLNAAKRISIAAGLYGPARWLSRRLRPAQLQAFKNDVSLFRELLPPDALCFDVGANIGEKSEALLEAGARVVAFEPSPVVLPELQARLRHRKSWRLVPTALGREAAVATLYARESHGQSGLDSGWEGTVVGTYDVPVLTLDLATAHFGIPFYLKLDVEGWELEVLHGLSQPIPLISFEFYLKDEYVAKTIACLNRLLLLGPGRVNVTPAESSSFHFAEWIPLQEFVEWFPGDLDRTLPGSHYGDIFVRAEEHVG